MWPKVAMAAVFALGACAGSVVTAVRGSPAQFSVSPAGVVPLEQAPVRVAANGKARIHMLARGRSAFVGRLSVDPGGQVPLHRDASEEYVYVLQGGGRIVIDGRAADIGPGDTVYMPSGAEVSFENGASRLEVVQVFAGPESADKYRAWTEYGAAPGE